MAAPNRALSSYGTTRDRELVRALYAWVEAEHKVCQAAFVSLDRSRPGGFHGGISDELEDARAEKAWNKQYDTWHARERAVMDAWNHIQAVFGKDTVDHALDEGKHRIGALPYAD